MKWTSHKAITGAVVFAVTGSIVSSLCAAVGSIVPDLIEGMPGDDPTSERYRRWSERHRKGSHWFVPYLVLFLLLLIIAKLNGVSGMGLDDLYEMVVGELNTVGVYAYVFAFICLGSVFHIAEDAVCGTVPSLKPHRRIGLRLFYTGSPMEHAIAFSLSVGLIGGVIIRW